METRQNNIAALYARVSTAGQEHEQTIESQISEIKSRIEVDGLLLPTENIFVDDGWTGELLQRPGLDQMRDAAEENKFHTLYVYDRGRLSRVFAYQEIVIEELTNQGIKFVTLHDVQAVTPEERVLQAMQGVFHEYERVKIAERFRRGKLFKAKSGKLINGQSLYGYTYIKRGNEDSAKYEINTEEAEVVKMLFNWIGNERISLKEAIRRLHEMNIPPRRGKTPYWTKGPLVRLLQCDSYIKGEVYYNKTESYVGKKRATSSKYRRVKKNSRKFRPKEEWLIHKIPPIIEDYSLFERVQVILEQNKYTAARRRKHNYLLSGIIYCGCGNRRVGDGYSKGANHYYRCTERIYKFPAPKTCTLKGVNALALENKLWEELSRLLTNPETLSQHAQIWSESRNDTTEFIKKEKDRLLELITQVKEEELRYAKAYGGQTLEFDQFKLLTQETKRKKAIYQNQIDNLRIEPSNSIPSDITIDEVCKEATEIIKSIDPNTKTKIIRDIIDKVTIKGNHEVEVEAHLPLTVNMAYQNGNRNRRTPKRGKINSLQCATQKNSRSCSQLSLCNNRT